VVYVWAFYRLGYACTSLHILFLSLISFDLLLRLVHCPFSLSLSLTFHVSPSIPYVLPHGYHRFPLRRRRRAIVPRSAAHDTLAMKKKSKNRRRLRVATLCEFA